MPKPRWDAIHHQRGGWLHAYWTARPGWEQVRAAVADSCLLAVSCLITYWLATTILALAPVSKAGNVLGGMWAVIATVFVLRHSYHKSLGAALSRMAATLVSFVLCLAYLLYLPFHAWGLAALIGLSSLAVTLIGRPGDAVTAAITTAVVMVVAELSPYDAWQQPNLRLADTTIGSQWVPRQPGSACSSSARKPTRLQPSDAPQEGP